MCGYLALLMHACMHALYYNLTSSSGNLYKNLALTLTVCMPTIARHACLLRVLFYDGINDPGVCGP